MPNGVVLNKCEWTRATFDAATDTVTISVDGFTEDGKAKAAELTYRRTATPGELYEAVKAWIESEVQAAQEE